MAATWITPGVGWAFTLLGWWMSPTISFHLNKFFSYLDLDTSRKLRDLEVDTIPKLRQTLRDAEEQRMTGEAEVKVPHSDLIVLDKIMKDLKSALHEAEDILDVVDYQKIEKRVIGHGPTGAFISRVMTCIGSWAQHVHGAAGSLISLCKRSCSDLWMGFVIMFVLRWVADDCISRCKRACSEKWSHVVISVHLRCSATGAWISHYFRQTMGVPRAALLLSSNADAGSGPDPPQEVHIYIPSESVSIAQAISREEEGFKHILDEEEFDSAESDSSAEDTPIQTSSAESEHSDEGEESDSSAEDTPIQTSSAESEHSDEGEESDSSAEDTPIQTSSAESEHSDEGEDSSAESTDDTTTQTSTAESDNLDEREFSCAQSDSRAEDTSLETSRAESVSIVDKLGVPWIIKCCRWILTYLINVVANVLDYRDWSNEAFGVRNNKEDDWALDSFARTVSRIWLGKKLQQIEDILNHSTNSHLLNQKSNSNCVIPAKDTNMESSSSKIADNNTKKESSSRQEQIKNLSRKIERKVFGREKELAHICGLFRKRPDVKGISSSSSKPYYVFGIHGIAGSGKSTLANYICDHETKAQNKHFDHIMFSHVSVTFRVDKIFRDMLREIRKDRKSDGKDIESLRHEVMENIKGKRFLLVLDDLWVNDKNLEEREILLDALHAGKNGSVILVTAQREDAAAALGAQEQIPIHNLEEKVYLSLFMHHALKGAVDDDGKFEKIGRTIAKKLHGSPIAAVTVARRLQLEKSISFWETTEKLDMLNETMGALWWSYQQLGVDIRRCFAYCSSFPRGYELNRDELVRIWIAQGFVNPTRNAAEELEDVGLLYILELLNFSFLQIRTTETFTVHDLLHELAQRVAGSDFLRIDLNGLPKYISPGVRHVFIEAKNGAEIAEKIQGLENLRTLVIEEPNTCTDFMQQAREPVKRNHDLEKMLGRLFKRLRKLRVLVIKLDYYSIEFLLPVSIDQMKHLRYLGICFSGLEAKLVLPGTFCKLYHMQTIYVPSYIEISSLRGHLIELGYIGISYPEGMANLIHLRHISGSPGFPNVGSLTSLQTMGRFDVDKGQGYELKQLKDLNKLRGHLWIDGLANVGSKEEALEAHLASKKGVADLKLCFFGSTTEPNIDEAEILEGLCPPNDLEELSIVAYSGSRYPSWMLSRQQQDALKHLHTLEFSLNCSPLASFPEDSELFECLRELTIECCDWVSLPENMDRLLSLQSLNIHGCDKIKLLPTLPRSLKEISIVSCRVLSKTCQKEGHKNWQKIQDIAVKYIG